MNATTGSFEWWMSAARSTLSAFEPPALECPLDLFTVGLSAGLSAPKRTPAGSTETATRQASTTKGGRERPGAGVQPSLPGESSKPRELVMATVSNRENDAVRDSEPRRGEA